MRERVQAGGREEVRREGRRVHVQCIIGRREREQEGRGESRSKRGEKERGETVICTCTAIVS